MRTLLALTLALTAACATFPRTPPQPQTGAIQPLLGPLGVCTAWSVAPGRWLTAGHCIAVGGADGWTIASVPARVLAVDPTHDIALLSGPDAAVLRLADAAPPIGAAVVTYGYGVSRRLLLQFDARLMANESDFFDGNDAPMAIVGGANGMSGMSGGPILYRGRVVSQISGGGMPTAMTHLVGSGVSWAALRAFVARELSRQPQRWGTD